MTKEYFGNAREILNMMVSLKEVWSEEYYEKIRKYGAENTVLEKVFYAKHFHKIMPPKKEVSVNDLIGLSTLKDKLEMFKKQVMYQKHLKEKGITNLMNFSMHMIFTGNPGTGKTTVAKLIADDLYSIGVLKTNHLVVVERKDFVSYILGGAAQKAADFVKKAVGGVLFVDEAYTLADGNGHEVIEVFLTAMEEHKADMVFIFAGYVNEMQRFIAINPGIQSRIGYTFHFEDYSADELTRMYEKKMVESGFELLGDCVDRVRDIMEYFQGAKNFGNGRFVNHVIQQTISQRANRDFIDKYRDITSEDIPSIKTLITTAPNSMQLYDPAKVTENERRKTVLHELGHAIISCVLETATQPEIISIKNQAGSFGRVQYTTNPTHAMTEKEMLNMIAVVLGGKNAEKIFCGGHSVGCASDYASAKKMAQDMIELFAMDSFGETSSEIIKCADKLSMEIITEYKDFVLSCLEILLKNKEIAGEEFIRMFEVAQAEKKKANNV